MESTYFPVEFTDLAASIYFHSITEGQYRISDISLNTFFINHPGYALGYRFEYSGKSITYISDNEPFATDGLHPFIKTRAQQKQKDIQHISVEELFNDYQDNKNHELVAKIRHTDILIHDAQYFPAEYHTHKLWGHSPFTFPIEIAKEANVKKLILFHHDPNHDDEILDRLFKEALEFGASIGFSGEILMARELDIHLL
jgi:hypothetical protein